MTSRPRAGGPPNVAAYWESLAYNAAAFIIELERLNDPPPLL